MAHALLSASGAHMWLACTPSARIEENLKDRDTKYTREGTLAHEIAENRLRRSLQLADPSTLDTQLAELQKSELYTPSMLDYVSEYVEIVLEKYNEAKARTSDAMIFIEAKLDYSVYVPDGFGTGDAVIIADDRMEVIDLKFGQGKPVSALNNPQLRLYALGAYEGYGFMYDVREIVMTIVQPRLDSISSDKTSVPELLDWAKQVVAPKAELAYRGLGEYAPGTHCGFCKARARCRARAEKMQDLTAYEFKHPDLLDRDEIGAVLTVAKALTEWAESVKAYAFEELTAGRTIPGWKLVEGRSNRTITDPEKAKEILAAAGNEDDYLKPRELRGITDLEKNFGKKQLAALIGSLIEKPKGKATMAPEADSRPALGSMEKDFENEDF